MMIDAERSKFIVKVAEFEKEAAIVKAEGESEGRSAPGGIVGRPVRGIYRVPVKQNQTYRCLPVVQTIRYF